jgi:hypothetical protein
MMRMLMETGNWPGFFLYRRVLWVFDGDGQESLRPGETHFRQTGPRACCREDKCLGWMLGLHVYMRTAGDE